MVALQKVCCEENGGEEHFRKNVDTIPSMSAFSQEGDCKALQYERNPLQLRNYTVRNELKTSSVTILNQNPLKSATGFTLHNNSLNSTNSFS